MRPETLVRQRAMHRVMRTLLELLDATRGDAVRVPRAVLQDLLTLLGTPPQRRCLVCETPLIGTRKRQYCRDACRAKGLRLRQGWRPVRQRRRHAPALWEEMAAVLKGTLGGRDA